MQKRDSSTGRAAGQSSNGRTARQPLYRHIKELLRDRILHGDLRPGDQAPSEQDLITEFRVSSITARRCLNDLEAEGFVQRLQGKGTFVRDRDPAATARHIGIFYHELASVTNSFVSSVLKGISEQLGYTDYQPELLTWAALRRSAHPDRQLAEIVGQRSIRGIIILSPAPLPWLNEVLKAGIPIVSVNMEYQDERVYSVRSDPLQGIARLLQRFESLGHRRVVVMREVFPESIEGVITASRAGGWTHPFVHCQMETFPYGAFARAESIVDLHLSGAEPATAFVTQGYELSLQVRQCIEAKGLRIPDDVSLVHWGPCPGPSKLSAELLDGDALGSETVRVLGTLLAGHVPIQRVICIPTQSHAGNTLGPAPSSRGRRETLPSVATTT